MREHLETRDGKRIMVDCGACGGCGEGGPGGFACGTCGGTGYFVYDKPKRDYEAAGRRAFEAGKPLAANPYRYGWPSHGWMLGWIDASDDAKKVPASQRLDLLMPNAGDKPPQVGLD